MLDSFGLLLLCFRQKIAILTPLGLLAGANVCLWQENPHTCYILSRPARIFRARMYCLGGAYTCSGPYRLHNLPLGMIILS